MTCNIGDLKYGADTSGDELSRRVDALLSVLDKDGNLTCAGRLENFGQLRNRLLENLRWTNINFSDDNHDWDIESKCDSEMLSGHRLARVKHPTMMPATHLLMPIRPLFAATMRRQ